jgi:hypothetical protein
MIKSLNKEIDVNQIDNMMTELEERSEFSCFLDACLVQFQWWCLPAVCLLGGCLIT